MVKALGLMYCNLFPLKHDSPVLSGRTLRFVNAPLPTTPHGSPGMVWPAGIPQGAPPAREVQVVPSRPPEMVRALPVATLTTVLVSQPPATPFTMAFCPSKPGRL